MAANRGVAPPGLTARTRCKVHPAGGAVLEDDQRAIRLLRVPRFDPAAGDLPRHLRDAHRIGPSRSWFQALAAAKSSAHVTDPPTVWIVPRSWETCWYRAAVASISEKRSGYRAVPVFVGFPPTRSSSLAPGGQRRRLGSRDRTTSRFGSGQRCRRPLVATVHGLRLWVQSHTPRLNVIGTMQ